MGVGTGGPVCAVAVAAAATAAAAGARSRAHKGTASRLLCTLAPAPAPEAVEKSASEPVTLGEAALPTPYKGEAGRERRPDIPTQRFDHEPRRRHISKP